MPWDKIERIYNKSLLNQHNRGGNKPARMVIGALIIKHKMNLSDEETIRFIAKNPYMQFLSDWKILRVSRYSIRVYSFTLTNA